MSKPKVRKPAKLGGCGAEIERLLYVNETIGIFLKQAHMLLDRQEFPESFSVIATLSRAFENELETNLLRAYERTGAE